MFPQDPNNPLNTQPASPPPLPQPLSATQQSATDHELRKTALVYRVVYRVFITFIILVLAIVVITVIYEMATQKTARRSPQYKQPADVNMMISQKPIFGLDFPAVNCWPTENIYAQNQQAWLNGTTTCLNSVWKAEFDAKNEKFYDLSDIKLADFNTLITSCNTENSKISKDAGFYCRAETTMYINTNMSHSYFEIKRLVSHEFAHHLQMINFIGVDSEISLEDLYKDYPSKQKESLDVVIQRNKHRSEIGADCIAIGLLAKSGDINPTKDKNVLDDFISIVKVELDDDPNLYGNRKTRTLMVERATEAGANMQSCNTWSWPDSEVE